MPQGPEGEIEQPGLDTFRPTPDEFPTPAQPSNYFDGRNLDAYTTQSRQRYGLGGQPDSGLWRHSYLYVAEYPINRRGDQSQTGTIELRGRTWSHEQQLPDDYKAAVKAAAHKAAVLFNSSTETPKYSGYLDGFDAGAGNLGAGGKMEDSARWEDADQRHDYDASEAAAGKIDWNVEIYDESDQLRGIAQGLAYPWRSTERRVPGEEPVDVAKHVWTLGDGRRDDYQVAPPSRKAARDRYRDGAGNGKKVYVNGLPIGRVDDNGRTWLTPEYGRGDPEKTSGRFGTYYSREGLINRTAATPQALRKGGNLYVTGETEARINLRTAGALPDGYDRRKAASDDAADAVNPNLEARSGRAGRTERLLSIAAPGDTVPIRCTDDVAITNALGLSMPEYVHGIARRWYVR